MALRLWDQARWRVQHGPASWCSMKAQHAIRRLPLSAGKPSAPGHGDVSRTDLFRVTARAERSESQGRFGVDVDVGLRSCAGMPGHARITMVECEFRAVEDPFLLAGTSCAESPTPLDFEKLEGNVELLFFSCHGGPDPNHPFSIALRIGPGSSCWTSTEDTAAELACAGMSP